MLDIFRLIEFYILSFKPNIPAYGSCVAIEPIEPVKKVEIVQNIETATQLNNPTVYVESLDLSTMYTYEPNTCICQSVSNMFEKLYNIDSSVYIDTYFENSKTCVKMINVIINQPNVENNIKEEMTYILSKRFNVDAQSICVWTANNK